VLKGHSIMIRSSVRTEDNSILSREHLINLPGREGWNVTEMAGLSGDLKFHRCADPSSDPLSISPLSWLISIAPTGCVWP